MELITLTNSVTVNISRLSVNWLTGIRSAVIYTYITQTTLAQSKMAEFYLNPLTDDYGQFIRQKLLSKAAAVASGCVLWTGHVSKEGYGTTKVKSHFDDRRFTLSVHRLLFFIHTKQRLTSAMHVSHLCHEKLCLNIEHLSYEPAVVNIQRARCVEDGRCCGHGNYKDCIIRQ
ncbi:uncharacterized protein LOC144909676 [Branchiostoma floridae x Branchiostoma belcheri]